jgi:hypothetical protein
MPKPNPLVQGLERQPLSPSRERKTPTRGREVRPIKSAAAPSSRLGRVLVGGHYAPEVQTALKVIAAEERTTVQALLAEGINTVFAKRRKPEIAEIPTS